MRHCRFKVRRSAEALQESATTSKLGDSVMEHVLNGDAAHAFQQVKVMLSLSFQEFKLHWKQLDDCGHEVPPTILKNMCLRVVLLIWSGSLEEHIWNVKELVEIQLAWPPHWVIQDRQPDEVDDEAQVQRHLRFNPQLPVLHLAFWPTEDPEFSILDDVEASQRLATKWMMDMFLNTYFIDSIKSQSNDAYQKIVQVCEEYRRRFAENADTIASEIDKPEKESAEMCFKVCSGLICLGTDQIIKDGAAALSWLISTDVAGKAKLQPLRSLITALKQNPTWQAPLDRFVPKAGYEALEETHVLAAVEEISGSDTLVSFDRLDALAAKIFDEWVPGFRPQKLTALSNATLEHAENLYDRHFAAEDLSAYDPETLSHQLGILNNLARRFPDDHEAGGGLRNKTQSKSKLADSKRRSLKLEQLTTETGLADLLATLSETMDIVLLPEQRLALRALYVTTRSTMLEQLSPPTRAPRSDLDLQFKVMHCFQTRDQDIVTWNELEHEKASHEVIINSVLPACFQVRSAFTNWNALPGDTDAKKAANAPESEDQLGWSLEPSASNLEAIAHDIGYDVSNLWGGENQLGREMVKVYSTCSGFIVYSILLTGVRTYTSTYTHTHIRTHTNTHKHIHIHTHTYTHTYTHIRTYTHRNTHTHTHT